MKRILEGLKQHFQSSCGTTDQWVKFARMFKHDFKKFLKPYTKAVGISRGHFYIYGFFELNNGKIYYFSISDVRFSPGAPMLIRTAKSFKDFTGGSNGYIHLDENFEQNLLQIVKI